MIDRSRRPKSATGAWTASPTVASTPSQLTPATHTVTPRDRSQPSFDSYDHPVAASAVLSDLQQQLEDQRKYRRQLEISRVIEQAEHVEFKDTIAALRVTLEAEQLDFQHQLDHTTAVLGQLTLGQAEIQTSMSEQKSQHSSEISALRDDVAALTDSIRALLLSRTSSSPSTPPRFLQIDSDSPATDSDSPLALEQKRLRSPSKQAPRVSKLSRTTEGMDTADDPSVSHSLIHQP